MSNLFDRGPLQQDSGLLSERWNQEGSVIVNKTDDITNPAVNSTVHTVTPGKTLFVTDVTIQIRACSGGANGAFQVRDAAGGSDVLIVQTEDYTGGEVVTFNLKTPLKISTSLYWKFNESGTADAYIMISGWEE